jgi:serine/threonine protein kinase, bacterial
MAHPAVMTPTSDDPGNEPSTFGRYELSEVLGRGGMGEVWRAHDTRHDHDVALKLLAPQWSDNPEFRRRFQREAAATAALDSPHVIPIHDHGEIDGRLYLAMPLITGADLGTLITAHPDGLDPNQAVTLTGQIAAALTAAHHAGLIHRDVKPANILLDADGPSADHAYLVDFGIARIADDTRDTPLTATGDTLGTPAYMAPELFTAAEATVASDVYALGCVLFELLTGHRPYQAPTTTALIAQHLYEPIPHPSDSNPTLATYDAVITRTLAKTPDQRYPTTHTLIQALQHAHTEPVTESREDLDESGATGVDATESGEHTGVEAPVDPPTTRALLGRPGWSGRRGVLLVVLAIVIVGGVVGVLLRAHGDATTSSPGITATSATGPLAVPVPSNTPDSITFSPDGRRAYIAQTDTQTLSVVDTADGHEIARVPTPEGSGTIAVSSDGTRAYISGYRGFDQPGSRVTVLDTTTNTVVGTVPAGNNPEGAALSSDGRRLFVTDDGTATVFGATVSVIDTLTDTLISTIPTGLAPTEICRSPDGTRLYVPDLESSDPTTAIVTVIDTTTGRTSELRAGTASPVDCALSPDGRRLYLVALGPPDSTSGGIDVVDTTTGTSTAIAPGLVTVPTAVALTPDGRWLVVADSGTDQSPRRAVTIIDTATGAPRQTFTLPGRPLGAAVRPDGREAWVTVEAPSGVWRLPLP